MLEAFITFLLSISKTKAAEVSVVIPMLEQNVRLHSYLRLYAQDAIAVSI